MGKETVPGGIPNEIIVSGLELLDVAEYEILMHILGGRGLSTEILASNTQPKDISHSPEVAKFDTSMFQDGKAYIDLPELKKQRGPLAKTLPTQLWNSLVGFREDYLRIKQKKDEGGELNQYEERVFLNADAIHFVPEAITGHSKDQKLALAPLYQRAISDPALLKSIDGIGTMSAELLVRVINDCLKPGYKTLDNPYWHERWRPK